MTYYLDDAGLPQIAMVHVYIYDVQRQALTGRNRGGEGNFHILRHLPRLAGMYHNLGLEVYRNPGLGGAGHEDNDPMADRLVNCITRLAEPDCLGQEAVEQIVTLLAGVWHLDRDRTGQGLDVAAQLLGLTSDEVGSQLRAVQAERAEHGGSGSWDDALEAFGEEVYARFIDVGGPFVEVAARLVYCVYLFAPRFLRLSSCSPVLCLSSCPPGLMVPRGVEVEGTDRSTSPSA
jgi:hypothetical protein